MIRNHCIIPDQPFVSTASTYKKLPLRCAIAILLSLTTLLLCGGLGSVSITLPQILQILEHQIFGSALPQDLDPSLVSILWTIRMPRAMTAFLVGAALSVSGAVMQAVLQNPLASSYTLGVSSGASLGAAIIVVSGISIPFLGAFLLPAFGFAFGFATVLIVLAICSRMESGVQSNTVILLGMVVSLFVNAILTLVTALSQNHIQQLFLWQMGSFAGRRWYHVAVLLPTAVLGTLLLCRFHRELDIMTFGDEQAMTMGVDIARVKKILLLIASLMTGIAVCFSGTIGFIDLIAPHMVRRVFGARHRILLPMSALLGGAFMALSDLISRTILSPQEIPVGAVTALIGAPFFLWVYFGRRAAA